MLFIKIDAVLFFKWLRISATTYVLALSLNVLSVLSVVSNVNAL